jgi:DME family drug/metabolite transporter
MAIGCTVVPMAALLGGVRRVGPSTASTIATAEPLVTAALAMLVVGERLAPVQWLGAALVVGAVLWLRGSRPRRDPAPDADPAPAVREPVGEPA